MRKDGVTSWKSFHVKMSVYISCFDIDGDSCEEIEKELQKPHMNIIRHENTPGRFLLSDGDNREGWIIVIVSKESLKSELLSFNLIKCLTADVDDGRLRILLVLRSGVNISEVPRCIRWVTVFSEDEKSYKNWIVRTVSGNLHQCMSHHN
ncbi:hypothetical protein DPMN_028861 [Dreissena polymorpha]|uniref:Uncharacterized protein n=1 Tax=Dreissena polymorpha TaxID=45954 RepID=A0A9D4RGJ1_DREPO|nr:hypothetical protein DPMN_028861 [Dreissena polymorpha]